MFRSLQALEAMEESRIVTMRSIFEEGCLTWGGSFTHQPEALGAVQKIIRNIDEQKDLQNWVMGNKYETLTVMALGTFLTNHILQNWTTATRATCGGALAASIQVS